MGQKNSKFVGHTNYGNIKGKEPDTVASNGLVFMASGLKQPWFVPIVYFLTSKLNADILKQLIYEAINLLTEKGENVYAIILMVLGKTSAWPTN